MKETISDYFLLKVMKYFTRIQWSKGGILPNNPDTFKKGFVQENEPVRNSGLIACHNKIS